MQCILLPFHPTFPNYSNFFSFILKNFHSFNQREGDLSLISESMSNGKEIRRCDNKISSWKIVEYFSGTVLPETVNPHDLLPLDIFLKSYDPFYAEKESYLFNQNITAPFGSLFHPL